jgi:hypothetical protein
MATPKSILCAIMVFSLFGCATRPIVPAGSVESVQITSFSPSSDRAVVYLYRDRTSNYGLFELTLDIGKDTISTHPACYIRIELEPGQYHFEANHPSLFGFEDEMDFNAVAGHVSFFEYKPIARFIVPGSTKIITKYKEEATATITSQKLCSLPIIKLPGRQ